MELTEEQKEIRREKARNKYAEKMNDPTQREERNKKSKEYNKAWRITNPDKQKAIAARNYEKNKPKIKVKAKLHYDENKGQILEQKSTYLLENREEINARRRERYKENPEAFQEANKAWRTANPDKVLQGVKEWTLKKKKDPEWVAKDREVRRIRATENRKQGKLSTYVADRCRIDPCFKLSLQLRGRLSKAIKKGYKAGSAVKDLGCSVAEARAHLESLFTEGMTWENFGKGEERWTIDHIMPLSKFDLTDRQHVVLAVNYLNLQPMWYLDNIRKHNTIPTHLFALP